jgi:hypothetical protein
MPPYGKERQALRDEPFYEMILVMYYLVFIIILSGVRLSPLGTAATIGLLYQHR